MSISRLILGAAAALALLAAPAPARSQQAEGSAASVLAGLEVGEHVRVRTRNGETVQGTLVAAGDAAVTVRTDVRAHTLALADVTHVWIRGRHVKRGALIGGGVGLLAGLGVGALAAALNEYGEDDPGAVVAEVGLAGAVAGATVGGIVGAAVPRWKRVYPGGRPRAGDVDATPADGAEDAADPTPPVAEVPVAEPAPSGGETAGAASPATERRRVGSLTLTGGFARMTGGGSSGGPEARVSFLGEWYLSGTPGGRRVFFSLGPEAGLARLGTTPSRERQYPVTTCTPECTTTFDTVMETREYEAVVVRGLTRLGVEDGRFRGYVAAGVGTQGWRTAVTTDPPLEDRPSGYDASFYGVGTTLGAGLQLRTGLRDAMGIEARHNRIRTYFDEFGEGYWNVSATFTRTW